MPVIENMNDIILMIPCTRNWYKYLAVEICSIFENNENVKIYLVLEDDEFPYFKGDKRIIVYNVYKMPKIISEKSPNYSTRYTIMGCATMSLYDWIPEDKGILLDVDILIDGSLQELWDMDMEDNLVGAVVEKAAGRVHYFNSGMTLMNLKALREEGVGASAAEKYNHRKYLYVFQDCYNEFCEGRVLELPAKWNATFFTGRPKDAVVLHGARSDFKFWNQNVIYHDKWLKYLDIFEKKYGVR